MELTRTVVLSQASKRAAGGGSIAAPSRSKRLPMFSDYTPAVELLGQHRAEAVIADKGYDADKIVEYVEQSMRAQAAIPPRSNRKQ